MAQEGPSWVPQAELVVRDPNQAQLLTESKSKDFFKPFVARELTASQAAQDVGCELSTMLYRIKTCQAAGLLTVVRQEKRAGRPLKVYRAVADAFFIPFDLTPYADYEERLVEQLSPVWHQVARGLAADGRVRGRQGERVHRDAQGTVWTTRVEALDRQLLRELEDAGTYYADAVVSLSDEQARALVLSLKELFTRAYNASMPEQGKRYTLQLAFVPTEPSG